ncbi:hypothetical protein [Falsiroseomonas ponticola]|uniref:hypothetical protein n=1 Tax=Falsiroseomonas ponticola TaxID=2786951 RepID=UPI001931CE40|nr:hypothetical protein [Roseomonas ponticola]
MGGSRQRTNPADGALARLADLAGRGVTAGRMAREVEAIVADWLGGERPAAPDEVAERLSAMHEQLVAGASDAAEQLSDIDRSDTAGLRHAGLVHAALEAALRAVEAAQDAARQSTPVEPAALTSPPPAAIPARIVPSDLRPAAEATLVEPVTIPPLAVRNPQGVDLSYPAEMRAESAASVPVTSPQTTGRTSRKRASKKTTSHEQTSQGLLA